MPPPFCTVCRCRPCRCVRWTENHSRALGFMFVAVVIMGFMVALMMGCGPSEIPPAAGDNMRCRCVDLDEFFIRGRIRSGITLRGGKVRVTGDGLECDLDCEVDRVEAE